MKFLIHHFLLGVMVLVPLKSFAVSSWCSGTITHTYLDAAGTLFIHGTWRENHTAICNVNDPRLGVATETCKGWLSIAMAAKLSKTKVILHYADVPSCSEIPQYSAAPNPTYLMLSE